LRTALRRVRAGRSTVACRIDGGGAVFSRELKVRAGDTIESRNADPFPHNATARDGGFRSGDIGPGQSWHSRVDTKGRFRYACTLHPGMKAELVVE
jgi:plastocyanin